MLASAMSVGIGKNEDAMHPFDYAILGAGVARQSGVSNRIDVARTHRIARPKRSYCHGRPIAWSSARQGRGHVLWSQGAFDRGWRRQGLAEAKFVRAYQATGERQPLKALGPDFVIAGGQIIGRFERFPGEAA